MNEKIPITDDMPDDLKAAIKFLNDNNASLHPPKPDMHVLDGITYHDDMFDSVSDDELEEVEIVDDLSEEDISDENIEDLENLF